MPVYLDVVTAQRYAQKAAVNILIQSPSPHMRCRCRLSNSTTRAWTFHYA